MIFINYFSVFIFVFVWVIPTSRNTQVTVNDDQNVGLNNNTLGIYHNWSKSKLFRVSELKQFISE